MDKEDKRTVVLHLDNSDRGVRDLRAIVEKVPFAQKELRHMITSVANDLEFVNTELRDHVARL